MTTSPVSGVNYPFETETNTQLKPTTIHALGSYGDFYSIVRKRGTRTWCFLTQEARDKFAQDFKGFSK